MWEMLWFRGIDHDTYFQISLITESHSSSVSIKGYIPLFERSRSLIKSCTLCSVTDIEDQESQVRGTI